MSSPFDQLAKHALLLHNHITNTPHQEQRLNFFHSSNMDLNLQLLAISGIISLISLYVVLLIGKTTTARRSRKHPPEPAGAWPVLGHLHLLGGGSDKPLHHTLAAMADEYGPAFSLRFGSRRAFVVASKELAKECLATNDRAFSSKPTTAATKHMCYDHGLFGFAPYSPHWREMRKIVTFELLSNRRQQIVKNVLHSEVDLAITKLYSVWAEKKGSQVLVQLNQLFEDLALNVTVRIVAGKRFCCGSDDREARWCQKTIANFFYLMGIFVVSDAFPFLGLLDFQGHEKAMKKTAKDLDAILEGWVVEHRQKKASGVMEAEGEQDFLDIMLLLEDQGRFSGFRYDENTSIKGNCLAVIAGGSDTTATVLTWAIALLLNNRFALNKAQEELDLQVGVERQVEESDIKNLVYLQAIVKETLRLYPVAPLSGPRESMEDCNVSGYGIPAGTRLIVNVWKIQRDPRFWEEPTRFKPERFLTTHADVDFRGQHFELIPFGSGRRSCPGVSLALNVLHLTLARLVQSFDLATPMDEPVDMSEGPGVITRKLTPLQVLIAPRLPPRLYC